MGLRMPSWRTCFTVGWSGLALVFVADLAFGDGEGWETFLAGLAGAFEGLSRAWSALRLDTKRQPFIGVWLAVATAAVLLAWATVRGRPTRRAAIALVAATTILALTAIFLLWSDLDHFHNDNTAGVLSWAWLAMLVALALGAWMRRREELTAIASWERRASPPYGHMPSLAHLPDALAELVRETRSVRTSFEPMFGLDRDARRLLWEWCWRIDACAEARLGELGLGSQPVRAAMNRERSAGTVVLLEVDAALARIENALFDDRSFAFR
jgi:uncharacterized membrane protein (UPF0136 family)